MFTMDVPSVPAQQTPIVLAQAASPATAPDYILKVCGETLSVGSNRLAANVIDPAGALAIYLGKKSNRDIYSSLAADTIKISLLETTKHGELITKIGSVGRTYYVYDPVPNYAGKDKSVFMAEFEGKRYKIILEFHVFAITPVESTWVDSCPPPKLIKVTKPSSGFNNRGQTTFLLETP